MARSNPEELIRMLVREELRREKLNEIQYTGYGGGFGYSGGGDLTKKTAGGTLSIVGGVIKGIPGVVKAVARNAPTLGAAFISGKLAWAAAHHNGFMEKVKSLASSMKSKFSSSADLIKILPPPGMTNPSFLLNFGTEIVKFDEGKDKNCSKITEALAKDIILLQREMGKINAESGMDKLVAMYGLFSNTDIDFDQATYDAAVKGLTDSTINSVFQDFMDGVFEAVADEITGIMNEKPETKTCLPGMAGSIAKIRSIT
jgi:hypothetical protein